MQDIEKIKRRGKALNKLKIMARIMEEQIQQHLGYEEAEKEEEEEEFSDNQ